MAVGFTQHDPSRTIRAPRGTELSASCRSVHPDPQIERIERLGFFPDVSRQVSHRFSATLLRAQA